MLTVRDTILYQQESKPTIRTIAAHIKTKPKPRLTDGKGTPPVKISKVNPKNVEGWWK